MTEYVMGLVEGDFAEDEWTEVTDGLDEVTRCGGCVHYGPAHPGGLEFCRLHSHAAAPEGFCAWAERRDDA